MKPASAAYRKSMAQTIRQRSFVEVVVFVEDPTAVSDGQWLDNGAVPYSEYGTVDYAYSYGPTYATLELNRWSLDGSQIILPSEGGYTAQGFVSNRTSKQDGTFDEAPVLVRKFGIEHPIRGFTLTFDSRCNAWPLTVTARFYLAGELIDTQEQRITSLTAVIETSKDYADEIRLSFTSTLPGTRPRVEYALYGTKITYTGATLSATSQKHEVDPLTRRLPKKTAKVTILDYENEYNPDNPSGVFRYIEDGARLRIQHGMTVGNAVEWLRPDEYFVEGAPSFSRNTVTFSAVGAMSRLTGTFYKSKIGRKSLYDMAEEVLLDANLALTSSGGHPWRIDTYLKDIFTTAVLPIDTHANCLKLIAHAGLCTLYVDDENNICIDRFGVTIRGIYSGTWADNGHTWYSEWDTVDLGNPGEIPFSSLELNRWVLDGSMGVLAEKNPEPRGYISLDTLDADGNAVPTSTPTFSKSFDVSHDVSVLALQFDNLARVYPSSVKVKYYNGETLLDTRIAQVDDTTVFVSSDTANDCTKIEVSMLTGLPYQRFRVSKVYYRENDFSMDFSTITDGSLETTKIDRLQAVSVAVYSFAQVGERTKLHESTVGQEELHVEFSYVATDVQITVEGGELISAQIYGRAADLVLTPGVKTVTVTGLTLEQPFSLYNYPVSGAGQIDYEENPLITDYDRAKALAEHTAAYLTMRNTYDASYRGNPELETGDVIGLQTYHTGEMDALILINEINYNGALSGKLKVKGLI